MPLASRGREQSGGAGIDRALGVVADAAPEVNSSLAAKQLFIDPAECIDCEACVEACPVDACFAEDQLPEEWTKYTEINLDYYKSKS